MDSTVFETSEQSDRASFEGESPAIRPYDASVIQRVLCGQNVNGETAAMMEPWKGLADRLVSLPLASRGEVCNEFVLKLGNADEIADSIADQNPNVHPSLIEAGGESGEAWPPLRLKETPKAAPFPIDVLPPAVARLATEGAESIGCPVDFIACSALAVASGAIGRSASLLLKSDYFASASLYVAIVGPPGDGKSPALGLASEPIREIGEKLHAEHKEATEQWKEACENRDRKSGEPKPDRPIPRRIDVDDATMERLIGMLGENPRGLLLAKDELTALFEGMNQYKGGRGSDRRGYCTIWSGQLINRDRIGQDAPEYTRCGHPSLSIVGGMTPDLLGTIADAQGRADGLQDRFLFAYPEPRPVPGWSDQGVSQAAKDGWAGIVERLWLRPMEASSEGENRPRVIRLSADGQTAWRDLIEAHAAEMNADGFPYALRGPWAKLREYAGRLTLVLSLMRHSADPSAHPESLPTATGRDVEDAWRLVAYFKSHAKRALDYGGPIGPAGTAVKAIIEWVRDKGLASFTESEARQARRWIDPESLDEALDHLTKKNAIRPQETAPRPTKGGRPPSPAYQVNPALLATGNPESAGNA